MKKIIALTLLTIYLNAAAQPLLPWIYDMVEHTFNWQEHMEHVHNGIRHSHHVGLELAAAEQESADHPVENHAFQFFKNVLSAHLIAATPQIVVSGVQSRVNISSGWHNFYNSVVGDVLLPPPNLLTINRLA